MSHRPTGTVTFLFTDIEGSTALWERDREAMQGALETHDALLRSAIAQHGGHLFKTVGDAFCAAFPRATDALETAIEAQRALQTGDWSALGTSGPLRVRMGLHTGEAAERAGDYFGPAVNRVARIEAAGHGGQILVSRVTRQRVEAEGVPDGCTFRDLGEHRLKDLRHSEQLSQVRAPGVPDVTRALRTAGELAPRDRIQVLDPHAGTPAAMPTVIERSVPETLAAIEAAVLRDTDGVLLTADQVRAASRHKPPDWRAWRLGRVAEWSQPRYRLDGRFVALTLLVDQGEEAVRGRWQAAEERYEDLGALLAELEAPAAVVLGPPGSGKSTLLRRLELDTAIAGLRGEPGGERVTFFVSLGTYGAAVPGAALAAPDEWLAERWAARAPVLPPLAELLGAGRVTFLLDALNEMPAGSESESRARVRLWKDWLVRLVTEQPGNRVVWSCRSLDYSQPLSTPELRVPQVRIEPLTDGQVRDFLAVYSPARWREIWADLEGSPQLEVLRSPYFLALLVEQVEATGELPAGRAALFTGFVRQALRREIERGSALFAPGALLTSRDVRRVAGWKWKGAYDLPERGVLVPKLAGLAHAMQEHREDGGASQVRIDLDEALELLATDADEAIVAAGEALAVLDEDEVAEELMYVHQLVQEYFAARELARHPDAELVRAEWRAAEVSPSVEEVIDELDLADPLPGLPQTGWEQTTLLAAAMAPVPEGLLRAVAETNLVLAARCAAQSEVAGRLSGEVLDELRTALVARTEDAEADLRHRIVCGYALGELGDPRFERRDGPHGEYLMPPVVEIPGGVYPIGDDEPIEYSYTGGGGTTRAHIRRHEVELEAFRIGRFPVTNAEWACFMAAGGYEDGRWWDTAAGRAWRRGELANEGAKANNRIWRERWLDDSDLFEQMVEEGRFVDEETVERWRGWLELDDAAFEAALTVQWASKRETEPRFWRDERFNHPAQPVVGVCWYEARAYCAWLGAQCGLEVRLPTEVEWEAAARGRQARAHVYGEASDRLAANMLETHVRRTTPVGVFPCGRTPEGVDDLSGNVDEWTSSLFGAGEPDRDETEHPYPYDPADGREDPDASPSVRRVVRGGAWYDALSYARAAFRYGLHPDSRDYSYGLRVVLPAASPIRNR